MTPIPTQDDDAARERVREIERKAEDRRIALEVMSEAELRRIEVAWKSDVDLKLDELIRMERARGMKYDAFLDMLIKREEKRAEFREAVILKGVIALLGTGIVAILTLLWMGVKAQLAESLKR